VHQYLLSSQSPTELGQRLGLALIALSCAVPSSFQASGLAEHSWSCSHAAAPWWNACGRTAAGEHRHVSMGASCLSTLHGPIVSLEVKGRAKKAVPVMMTGAALGCGG
jgi:hypothetical protein